MNVGEMQRKLSVWSMQRLQEPDNGLFASRKDLRLYGLYQLLCDPTWLCAAHDRVSQNAGSKTAGCDGINMARFDENLEERLQMLAEELRTQTYRPHPVRRVYIPKKDGKLRPLGIPSIRDRIVQEALRMVLEPIFEAEFYRHSYGFRPQRSVQDAVATVIQHASNRARYFWVIEGDIKSYFDTIHHQKLMELLRRRIRDKRLLRLVWRFLKAGVMEETLFTPTVAGTPQGGIVSPLLANVYLHELDRYVDRRFGDRRVREARRARGRCNFIHIRYADDFVVMCNGTKADAEAMKRELQKFLADELKLTLSGEKTKITHVNDGFRFLGFDIRREVTGTGIMWPKHTIPADAVKKFRAKVMEITAPSSGNQSITAKMTALNYLLRGWGHYYRTTYCACRKYADLDHFVFWRMAHWLGRKFKCSMPKVMRRFYQRVNGAVTLGHGSVALWRLSSLEFGPLRKRTFTNPYADPEPQLHREELMANRHQWTGNETRPGAEDLRLPVLERDQWACQYCGRKVDAVTGRLDHIRPLHRFRSPKDATTVANLQTLCAECHKQKTKRERIQQMESRML